MNEEKIIKRIRINYLIFIKEISRRKDFTHERKQKTFITTTGRNLKIKLTCIQYRKNSANIKTSILINSKIKSGLQSKNFGTLKARLIYINTRRAITLKS